MKYFYDHQTDALTLTFGEISRYAESVSLPDGITLHVDANRRPLALEMNQARRIADVSDLRPFDEQAIDRSDLARRLSVSERGRDVWRRMNFSLVA